MTEPQQQSGQERIKRESHFLRGNIAREIADVSSPELSDETYELLKFHGAYFGYDRDTAVARERAGMEKDYEFTVRIKCPGGRLTAAQYLALDALCDKYANGTLRITARETLQFHCVKKINLKPLVADINHALLSTFGAGGDVVHNIMTCPAPIKDNIHARLEEDCFRLAQHCTPKTDAYYEIWLDGEKIADYPFNPGPASEMNPEPLYGKTYMPHTFKIGIAQPEDNCIDVLSHDLAILSLFDGQEHAGYNFALGGGLSMNPDALSTYPRLATPIMYVPKELLIPATDAVIKLQRDHGDRGDREQARLKYLVQEKGGAWMKQALEGYLLQSMEAPKPMKKYAVEDHIGWHAQGDGKWFVGLPISSGRIMDRDKEAIRTGLREIIVEYGMDLRLTADQNIILCDIEEPEKLAIEYKLQRFGIKMKEDVTPAYRHMLACVALPNCGKALAEAERIKLPLAGEIEQVMEKHHVLDEKIAIRIAGCANGCSRPYMGDIGVVGCAPDHYSLYIGGDFEGTRLNQKIFDHVPLRHVARTLEPMFALWNSKKTAGEGFGDFCHRYGIDQVKQSAVLALAGCDWIK